MAGVEQGSNLWYRLPPGGLERDLKMAVPAVGVQANSGVFWCLSQNLAPVTGISGFQTIAVIPTQLGYNLAAGV